MAYPDYERRCREATTAQGLDPVVAALTAAGIQHAVEQTGGMTMVLTVPTGATSFLGVTRAEDDADEDRYLVGEYPTLDWEDGDCVYEAATLDQVVQLARERVKPRTLVEPRTISDWWDCAICGGTFAPQMVAMYWNGERWVAKACLHHPVDPRLFTR
jgi:hypothetical protein